MEERNKLLKKIQTCDFALFEAALYLDGHVNDKKALAYYNKYKNMRNELRREFEEKYGPLTINANNSENEWYWADRPWPWDMEAN